jgi:glycosyltransferase involved in cell wall biosynthesis
VSTSIGAEGLQVKGRKHLLIANTPLEFCKSIIELLNNNRLRENLGKQGRKLVVEQYDWKSAADKLINRYTELLGTDHHG